MNAQIHATQKPSLVSLPRAQDVTELLQRTPDELGLLPQVRSEVSVGVADSDEGGLEGVLQGLGGAGRGGVDIVDACKLEETLDGGGGNETGTTGSRDKLEKMSAWGSFPLISLGS